MDAMGRLHLQCAVVIWLALGAAAQANTALATQFFKGTGNIAADIKLWKSFPPQDTTQPIPVPPTISLDQPVILFYGKARPGHVAAGICSDGCPSLIDPQADLPSASAPALACLQHLQDATAASVGVPAGGTASPEPKACRPEVVRPAQGPAADRFVAWLKAHPEVRPEYSEDVLESPQIGREVFIADVDNDGQAESILASWGDRGGHGFDLWIYKRSGDGWVPVDEPEELAAASLGYYDPLREEASLFLLSCGKTLLLAEDGDGRHPWRHAYLWQAGKVKTVCDVAWLEEQRRSFQQLFDRGHLAQAYAFLAGAASSCQPPPDPTLWRWMQSDLALTAYRMRTYRTCLEHVTAAEKAPASGDMALAKALADDRRQCAAALAARPPAYDFTWLLEFKNHPEKVIAEPRSYGLLAAAVILDPRFDGLLTAAVPDVKFKNGESFRDVFELRLGRPGGVLFFSDRAVVLSGCMPHSCEEKAWIWVDLKRQRSIVLTNADLYESTAEERGFALALGSNTIPASQVPAEFWADIDAFFSRASGGLDARLSDLVIEGGRVGYAGPGGAWEEVPNASVDRH